MEKMVSDRVLEIFYRLIKGEIFNSKSLAENYNVSPKTISRDINRIKNFLAEHKELMNYAEIVYSSKLKSYILKSDELLKNSELFAILKVLLGARCFNSDDMLSIVQKLEKFTTLQNRDILTDIVDKEMHCYSEVHSDCDSVIENLWQIIKCIEEKRYITVTYLKMDRSEVMRKLRPASIMFSEYYFYLIAYDDSEPENAKYFRIDRIRHIRENREFFKDDKKYKFNEGNFRKQNQFMFPGDVVKIEFEFTGLSVQAVLDRIPSARIIRKNGRKNIISAEVNYGRGLIMYLLSQGSWIKVLSPQTLIDDMKEEIDKMKALYQVNN